MWYKTFPAHQWKLLERSITCQVWKLVGLKSCRSPALTLPVVVNQSTVDLLFGDSASSAFLSDNAFLLCRRVHLTGSCAYFCWTWGWTVSVSSDWLLTMKYIFLDFVWLYIHITGYLSIQCVCFNMRWFEKASCLTGHLFQVNSTRTWRCVTEMRQWQMWQQLLPWSTMIHYHKSYYSREDLCESLYLTGMISLLWWRTVLIYEQRTEILLQLLTTSN